MPRLNIKNGDSGTVPASWAAEYQDFVTPNRSGNLTLTCHGVKLYVATTEDTNDGGSVSTWVVLDDDRFPGSTQVIPIVQNQDYSITVAGMGATPSGTIDYSFVTT